MDKGEKDRLDRAGGRIGLGFAVLFATVSVTFAAQCAISGASQFKLGWAVTLFAWVAVSTASYLLGLIVATALSRLANWRGRHFCVDPLVLGMVVPAMQWVLVEHRLLASLSFGHIDGVAAILCSALISIACSALFEWWRSSRIADS